MNIVNSKISLMEANQMNPMSDRLRAIADHLSKKVSDAVRSAWRQEIFENFLLVYINNIIIDLYCISYCMQRYQLMHLMQMEMLI